MASTFNGLVPTELCCEMVPDALLSSEIAPSWENGCALTPKEVGGVRVAVSGKELSEAMRMTRTGSSQLWFPAASWSATGLCESCREMDPHGEAINNSNICLLYDRFQVNRASASRVADGTP